MLFLYQSFGGGALQKFGNIKIIIFNQKIHFNSVILLLKLKFNARVLPDVNSERPQAADVHLSLHSDLIIIIPLLQ